MEKTDVSSFAGKRLYILRHGKSDWNSSHEADHDRPLAPRGERDARRLGLFLAGLGQIPQGVLSSSARRARDTVKLAAEAGHWQSPVKVDEGLYSASWNTVLEEIQGQDDGLSSLLFAGHQPTVSALVQTLMGGGHVRMPTAALARLDFDASCWRQLTPGTGHLEWLVIPKVLPEPAS